MSKVLDRFLHYVSFDSQSMDDQEQVPSTEKQLALAKALKEELEAMGTGSLYRAAVEGDEKTGSFLAGQIAAIVNKEQPAAEIIREIFEEAETVLNGAKKWVK